MKKVFPTRLDYAVPVSLIVAASLLRVVVCFQHNPLNYLWPSDMLRYWHAGAQFPKAGYDGAADPILYQVYMFVLRKITCDNRILIALAATFLSVLMPWSYYRAVRNFGLRKKPALWIWALIACTPSLLTIYHYLMTETLLLLLEGVAFWMTARCLRKGGTEAFLSFIFAWTLACLTKPTVIPLAGICGLWVLWKRTPRIRDIAVAVMLVLILLLPQAIRTKAELGFIAPFGNPWFTKIQHRSGAKSIHVHFYNDAGSFGPFRTYSHINELRSSSPSANIRPLWPLSSWTMERALGESKITLTIHASHGTQDWKHAYEKLDLGWGEWLEQLRENVVLFFFSPSWPEWVKLDSEWDAKLEFWARWMWAPLIIFVLFCNARAFLRRRFDLIPVATTLFTLFLALQNVVTFEGRYRKPLEPLLLVNLVWILANGYLARRDQQLQTETVPSWPGASVH